MISGSRPLTHFNAFQNFFDQNLKIKWLAPKEIEGRNKTLYQSFSYQSTHFSPQAKTTFKTSQQLPLTKFLANSHA